MRHASQARSNNQQRTTELDSTAIDDKPRGQSLTASVCRGFDGETGGEQRVVSPRKAAPRLQPPSRPSPCPGGKDTLVLRNCLGGGRYVVLPGDALSGHGETQDEGAQEHFEE